MGPKANPHFINSLIGEGSTFRGDVSIEGMIRIDGDFWGNGETKARLVISPTGRVKATIRAHEVVIGGALKGDVYATGRVTLLETALVIGNIYAPRLVLEEGAVLEGYSSIKPPLKADAEGMPSWERTGPEPRRLYNPFAAKGDTQAWTG